MERGNIILVNYTLKPGGTERFISELSNYLSKEGYQVIIILLKKDEIFFKLGKPIKIIEPEFKNRNLNRWKLLYFLRLIPFLRKNISILKPALIINAAFPFYIMSALSNIKVPVILTIRCDPRKTKMIDGIIIPLWIRRLMYDRYSAIIAQTSLAAKILTNQFHKPKVVVIPNILSPVPFSEDHRENIIISAGRLVKGKGFDYLIRAFSKVNPLDWRLEIVGEGPEEKYLKELIVSFNLESKVHLLHNRYNIYEYFSRSKIFAFTSLSEGFPNVLLEAMATPLACISFDIDFGPRDLIKDGENGFLVPSGEIGDFASKLNILVNNADLRYRFMLQAVKVRETHDWKKVRIHYLDLFDSIRS